MTQNHPLTDAKIVIFEQSDIVPADSRLVEAFGVGVNNDTLTGESLPQAREAGPSEENIILSKNILLAGSSVVSGQARAIIFATGMQTEFGKIARLSQTGGEIVSPLRREVAYLSRVIFLLAVLVGVVFFAIGFAIGVPFWQDFIFAIGIIVAMVSEGLLPTLTLALVLATQRMAKRNVLIRHLPSVEALGSATVICTDKAGTLTQNRMTVKRLFLGASIEASAEGKQMQQLAERYVPFFLTAFLCHDLRQGIDRGKTRYLGDPMEIALVEMAQKVLPDLPAFPRVDEIPFDADRMSVSIVYATSEGNVLYCEGAPEAILPLCDRVLIDGETRQFGTSLHARVLAAQESMAEQGLRVLAFAYRALESRRDRNRLEE